MIVVTLPLGGQITQKCYAEFWNPVRGASFLLRAKRQCLAPREKKKWIHPIFSHLRNVNSFLKNVLMSSSGWMILNTINQIIVMNLDLETYYGKNALNRSISRSYASNTVAKYLLSHFADAPIATPSIFSH
jgi:hypothetical protein